MATTPLDTAFALLREGRAVEAQELLLRELHAVEASQGRGAPAWTSLQCDLGTVLFNSGQPDRAVEYFRNACAHPPPPDSDEYRDYLTYRLNLGMALQEAGRLAEAEAELRRGAEERLSYYGRQHAGYAFGLEPLADVLLRRGDLPQARQVVEETVANFWNNGHERVAGALALRAEIMSAEGAAGGLFAGLEALPDEVVETMAHTVMRRADANPTAARPVVADLAAMLEARLGPDHQTTLNALSVLANVARDAGDPVGRVAAIRRVLSSYDRQGRTEEALMAAQALAMAQDEVGEHDAALRTYADALARAEQVGRPEPISQTLRNWGLALAEAGQPAEAERRLDEAVAHARRGADPELLGRGLIALGLFLQHQERVSEARSATEEGLALMDPAHPDAVVARSHLGAMAQGRSCGCGDMAGAVAEAFRQFVVGRLPGDLLRDFTVKLVDGEFEVGVKLLREPTEDELAHLDRVIRTAHAEFRRRLTARS